jgi:SH3-like domain-containing protein
MAHSTWATAAGLVVLALAPLHSLAAGRGEKPERVTPSGLPVPRWVVLKFDNVNARSAPGDESRMLWVYHAKGLPVQVVAETAEWRRICDPERGMAWVHRRTTDGRRAAMRLKAEPLPIHAAANAESRIKAYLAPRALAELDRCDKAGWCRLKAGHTDGWVPAAEVWGTTEEPQCRR